MADIVITPASFIPSAAATIVFGVLGATVTQGQTVYVDTANSNVLKLADADASALSAVVLGFATVAGSSGQRIGVVTKDPALALGGASVLAGDPIYQSDIAGGVTKTFADLEAGDIVTVLGVMTSTTVMNLNPTRGGVIA